MIALLNGLNVFVQRQEAGVWATVAAFRSFMDAGAFMDNARKDAKLRACELRADGKLYPLKNFRS